MTTSTEYTLRPLERRIPSSLEGGFRVHLPKKEVEKLGLSPGDLCRIGTEKGNFAIAWNAQETNQGNKAIAKVTDLLREKYSLPLTERVPITKAIEPWRAIDTVLISLAGPVESLNGFDSPEEFLTWAGYALADIELILSGCTFEVQRKGPRFRQSPRLRVTIVHIEPPLDSIGPLYFDPLNSRINFANTPSPTRSDEMLQINGDGIGGLSDQINTINKCLAFLNDASFVLQDPHLIGPTSILIHGPEGTGKSLLLERLSKCSWEEVLKLDLEWLISNPKSQAKALSDAFERAGKSQPSLILMDDLDKFLKKAETLASRLRTELKKLEGSRVVVAAATRSVYDIDASLRTTSTFKVELEIFSPKMQQREEILQQILGMNRAVASVNWISLAERTNGFVGRDIHKLCGLARNHRVQSVYDSLEAEKRASFAEILGNSEFVTQDDFEAVIDEVRPTVLKDSILDVPKVKWTDIAGLDHVRELLNPDLDIKFGGPPSRKGVLLYGPPGCAKTLIAQAIATESNLPFLAVKGSELIKMYVGESEREIREVFRKARAAKPCIIFFDEVDSIGKSREKTQDSGLNVVTTLLNEMDGIEALKEVFIVAATNRPDILDSALIRTGRFDAHIHMGLPNEQARRQIFQIHTRKRPLAEDVDLNVLASRTEGSSGADIKSLCSNAVELAISDYEKIPDGQHAEPEIRMCHFKRALDKHVPHTIKEEAERYEGWRPGKSLSAD
ncbi:AAA-domain-containing protein [Zopfia rhizophila CBS 207.26]|uniref:AAA-domain-containing protein n=1 Tax=Zopfia rhizophila CBS 207.26 TaxID=1314779 RepID=A0A6A6ELJ9_9PEZI|nr:AAA-domain-containing protein [Zopfia rhizophila CBS 207.26]